MLPGLMVGAAQFAAALERIPNQEARELSPVVGWWLLGGMVCLAALYIAANERLKRLWLHAEDPRALGLMRICFGIFVIANINDVWEYFYFLFTDEGIFTADVARQVHASKQFEGFGDGFGPEDPWGFFDFRGFLQFLAGPKYSLLYIWDSPTAFWIHLWAFELFGAMFVVGLFTRFSGIMTWFLMNSLLYRNHLSWEGTELVFRVFLAYLICSPCGHAYSIDNWRRCRKLRAQGRLSERDGPGGGAGAPPSDAHPEGLEPIYRLVPAWPRLLMMINLAALMTYTGMVKNGGVWARGDAVYYALNLDHFYRFYPQPASAIFGTNLLRLMTWSAHWIEVFFPLAAVGWIARWVRREGPPLRAWQAWTVRAAWLGIIVVSCGILVVTWKVHHAPFPKPWGFVSGWAGLWLVLWALWYRLGTRGIRIGPRTRRWFLRGVVVGAIAVAGLLSHLFWSYRPLFGWVWTLPTAIVGGGLTASLLAWRFSPWTIGQVPLWGGPSGTGATIDLDWLCRWVLGRRIWLIAGVMLMFNIWILMNIGQFQTGMLSVHISFLTGLEVAIGLRFLGRRVLPRLGLGRFVPEDVLRGEPPTPPQRADDPALHRDDARLPTWAVLGIVVAIFAGIGVAIFVDPKWPWFRVWYPLPLVLLAIAVPYARRGRRRDSVEYPCPSGYPWAYGPMGRLFIGALLTWHIVGVAVWLSPNKDSMHAFRGKATSVFSLWLRTTSTDQSWGMFAPNPPRHNVFMKVLVTDRDGEVWDMHSDVYAPERHSVPFIWNDRMRKMNRRMIGGESGGGDWYRKWYARWQCRQWALEHDGLIPEKVELVKVSYKIPSPEAVRKRGWYHPRHRMQKDTTEVVKHTEVCKTTVMGQLPDWIRERHGLGPAPEGEKYRPWRKHKKKKWERKHRPKPEARDAKASAKAKAEADEKGPGPSKTKPQPKPDAKDLRPVPAKVQIHSN